MSASVSLVLLFRNYSPNVARSRRTFQPVPLIRLICFVVPMNHKLVQCRQRFFMDHMGRDVEICESLQLKVLLEKLCNDTDHVRGQDEMVSNLEKHKQGQRGVQNLRRVEGVWVGSTYSVTPIPLLFRLLRRFVFLRRHDGYLTESRCEVFVPMRESVPQY